MRRRLHRRRSARVGAKGTRTCLVALASGLALLVFAGTTSVKATARGIVVFGTQVCRGADPNGCTSELSLPAADGYKITVLGRVSGTGHNVSLVVHGHNAEIRYYAQGRVTPTSVNASFGRLGRISVHFQPSGKVRRVKIAKKCLHRYPQGVTARLGVFVGTIRFVGENDYTQAIAHRAKGGVGDPLAVGQRLECERGPKGSKRRQAHGVHLETNSESPYGEIHFEAWARLSWAFRPTTRNPAPRRDVDVFTASIDSRTEGVLIDRFVVAPGLAADFHFDHALNSAAVTPPAPFAGGAEFQRATDGSTTWTGDLSVELPGLGTVPLAGPSFESRLADDYVFRRG